MMYPIIEGDKVYFSEEIRRDVRNLEIPVTHQEFKLLEQKFGQGIAFIPEGSPAASDIAGTIAISSEHQVYRNPLNIITAGQYDDVVSQLGEVEKILEAHRKETSEK